MRNEAKLRPATAGLLLVVSAVLSLSCGSSKGNVAFRCGAQVNGGALLTVDVVRATEDEARRIQDLGEKWFYDPSRFSMRDKIQTVTFSAGDGARCSREVSLEAAKGDKVLVIVADYKFQSTDAGKQLMALPRDRWAGKKLVISVLDKELSLEARK